MTFGRRGAEGALLGVAALWGLTFPLVHSALADVDPARFLVARFALAAVAFLPLLALRPRSRRALRRALLPGLALGALAYAAYLTQTLALETTSASRVAFITGTNVILVPLLSPLFGRGRPRVADLALAAVATGGLWLLTDPAGGGLTAGDLEALACAGGYAVYLLALHGVLEQGHDALALAFLQVAGLAGVAAGWLPLAGPATGTLWTTPVIVAVAFTALGATVACFWLQTRFQGRTTPQRAALLLATEPVFALAFSFVLLGETLRARGAAGAALVLVAVLGASYPAERPGSTRAARVSSHRRAWAKTRKAS